MNEQHLAKTYQVKTCKGRYITNEKIEQFLTNLKHYFKIEVVGKSVENRPIFSVEFGCGKTKILMWSQMHGNESTTTKAVLDLLHYLNELTAEEVTDWQAKFTLTILPILNPDGAFYYTRANANQVDLNRDSVELTQPESKVLRRMLEEIQPDFAFNLHDQRSIFGVGDTGKAAAISFLAPAFNEERTINETRKRAIQIIEAMNEAVQKVAPGHVGRFDDSFNRNCIGDYAQAMGIPTILIEAGHLGTDYQRENTRELTCISLLRALHTIANHTYSTYSMQSYFSLPENTKSFNDVELRSVVNASSTRKFILKIQYKEILSEGNVKFCPIIVHIDEKESKFVHTLIEKECQLKSLFEQTDDILEQNFEDVVALSVEEVNYLLKK
ncbi:MULTISPECIES: M14 metallopeptidase family protein [unclassified Myroides]|uniref:M14 family metallopeptidase n=1 Tax=unclassified Myroides TaxID=2642485 RepID=UPI0015FCD7E6|nr:MULTISPECIES: M14 metallopeptidase family protein [unclassified Myroides]MBB1149923.1 peptidase M14 [Myroides sp. NP-2]MDM1408267.1 peptidase M14 [Myroides sp. DF42-4-2]